MLNTYNVKATGGIFILIFSGEFMKRRRNKNDKFSSGKETTNDD